MLLNQLIGVYSNSNEISLTEEMLPAVDFSVFNIENYGLRYLLKLNLVFRPRC